MENKNGFNKTIYYVILGCVTGVCVIIGSIRMGKTMGQGIVKGIRGLNINLPFDTAVSTGEAGKEIEMQEKLGDFSDVDIEADYMDIRIISGSEFGYSYEGIESMRPELAVKDGKLEVTQNIESVDVYIYPQKISIDSDLIITIPSGTQLGDVAIDLDLGNVTLIEQTMSNLDVEADLGNVSLSNVNVGMRADLELDLGNLEIASSTINETDCSVDMGDVKASGTFGLFKGVCSMGNMNI